VAALPLSTELSTEYARSSADGCSSVTLEMASNEAWFQSAAKLARIDERLRPFRDDETQKKSDILAALDKVCFPMNIELATCR